MDLEQEILILTCTLYSKLRLTKIDVQFIIVLIRNFIKIYNAFLLKTLQSNLHNAISDEASGEIIKTLNKFNDPFKAYSTEDKR